MALVTEDNQVTLILTPKPLICPVMNIQLFRSCADPALMMTNIECHRSGFLPMLGFQILMVSKTAQRLNRSKSWIKATPFDAGENLSDQIADGCYELISFSCCPVLGLDPLHAYRVVIWIGKVIIISLPAIRFFWFPERLWLWEVFIDECAR